MANNVEITILYDFYGDVLTEKQRDFLNYYYNDDLSLSEIAENEGITRQGVRDAIKRAEAQLYEMEEKLGFAAFGGVTQLALEKRVLSNYFGNIAFAYEDYGYPYCLATTIFNTGISQPRDYAKDAQFHPCRHN